MPFVLALTGGIASGKSAVCERIASLRVPVVDCDLIAREVQAPGSPCLERILSTWPSVKASDGSLNREALGSIIFSDPSQRQRLNKLMQPYLFVAIVSAVAAAAKQPGVPFVLLDIPLLYESKLFRPIAAVELVVAASDEVRITRLVKRDAAIRGTGADAERAAAQRIAAQMPLADKIKRCDIVVDNSGTLDVLKTETEKAIRSATDVARTHTWQTLRARIALVVYTGLARMLGYWLSWRDRNLL